MVALSIGGATLDLCLGLGALAELEDAFAVESFEEALDFGERVSATKMRTFLRALIKGNGIELTSEIEAGIGHLSIAEFLTLMNDLTAAAGMKAQEQEAAKAGGAPLKVRNVGKRG